MQGIAQLAQPERAAAASPTSHRVARNSALYFLSLALPAGAALFLVPVTVRALGPARFGLLALAWAVADGSGMFDFGMGRATVRFVAGAAESDRERLGEIIHASLLSQVLMGAIAGALLFLFSPSITRSVFRVSAPVQPEAIAMFRVLALHIPVILANTSLRASLEGAQRFDVSTSLRVPSTVASIAVPAIAASMGASLGTILWILLIVRSTLFFISALVVAKTLLPSGWAVPRSLRTLREMIGYSGWVAISTALSPALASFDRFVLGSLVGVAGLGYYAGASEAANRFLLIPATAFSALLPALSATDARGERARSLRVTRAALRQLAAVLLPVCLMLFAFAPQILAEWLGHAFGERSGQALRILTVGVFFGGLAHLPMALLYGSGRPDLPAKIHLGEVVVYLPLAFLLVREWGIVGAAVAWASRCTADFILYETVGHRALGRYVADDTERSRTAWLLGDAAGFVVLLSLAVFLSSFSIMFPAVLLVASALAYAALSWARVLSPEERKAWSGMFLRFRSGSQWAPKLQGG